MDDQEQEKLAKLGHVFKYHADRSAAATDKMVQGVASLQRSASSMSATGASLKSDIVNGVRGEVGQVAKQALDKSVEPTRAALHEEVLAFRHERQELRAEREALQRERRHRMIYEYGGLAVCSVLALVGIWAWGAHWVDKADAAEIKAEWAGIANTADIVRCGDGKLCANVDMEAEPVGDKKQYRPVKPRQ